MLQIAFIRENQEKVIQALAKRNMDAKTIVEEVVQLDEKRRATQVELDGVLSESNKLSKDIGDLMKSGEKSKATILKEKTILLYNTLLNSLSHELRTPISTILGASDTLKENEFNLSQTQRSELLNEIENASLRLNRQVENLLNMSRLESGMLEAKIDWCDVNEIINSMLHKLQATAHQQLLYSENQQLPLFKLDAGFLEQILHNILLNAIQYTPSHSTITVTAQHDDKNCMITISDNGPGIPVEELHLIFNKFHRVPNTKTGGSGLGLSIAKGFVEALGGNIRVTNNTQAGAQFTVTIPSEMNHLNHLKNE